MWIPQRIRREPSYGYSHGEGAMETMETVETTTTTTTTTTEQFQQMGQGGGWSMAPPQMIGPPLQRGLLPFGPPQPMQLVSNTSGGTMTYSTQAQSGMQSPQLQLPPPQPAAMDNLLQQYSQMSIQPAPPPPAVRSPPFVEQLQLPPPMNDSSTNQVTETKKDKGKRRTKSPEPKPESKKKEPNKYELVRHKSKKKPEASSNLMNVFSSSSKATSSKTSEKQHKSGQHVRTPITTMPAVPAVPSMANHSGQMMSMNAQHTSSQVAADPQMQMMQYGQQHGLQYGQQHAVMTQTHHTVHAQQQNLGQYAPTSTIPHVCRGQITTWHQLITTFSSGHMMHIYGYPGQKDKKGRTLQQRLHEVNNRPDRQPQTWPTWHGLDPRHEMQYRLCGEYPTMPKGAKGSAARNFAYEIGGIHAQMAHDEMVEDILSYDCAACPARLVWNQSEYGYNCDGSAHFVPHSEIDHVLAGNRPHGPYIWDRNMLRWGLGEELSVFYRSLVRSLADAIMGSALGVGPQV